MGVITVKGGGTLHTYETLMVVVVDGIATITLNRPHVRNAISLRMVEELHELLDILEQDTTVKVLIFTGAGSTFISGGDLEEFLSVRGEEAYPRLRKVGDLLDRLDAFSKPTIAMINGTAIGGGCEFAASCHFRLASNAAKIGFVQIGMHITSGWGGGSRLLSKLSEGQALTLLLTGERLDAKRAKELGFVDDCFPPEELDTKVHAFAQSIAAQPLEGIQAYLRLLGWKRAGIHETERVEMEIRQCTGMWGSEPHLSVVQQFLGKSK